MDSLPVGDMKGLGRNALAQVVFVVVLFLVGLFLPQIAGIGILFVIGVCFTMVNSVFYSHSVANQGEEMSLSGYIIAILALTGVTMVTLLVLVTVLAIFI